MFCRVFFIEVERCASDQRMGCPNHICVSLDSFCSPDINACGYPNMEKYCDDFRKEVISLMKHLVNSVQWFVIFVIMAAVTIHCIKKGLWKKIQAYCKKQVGLYFIFIVV